jgi:nitrate/nitrite-specific signal transduction histidine kinase
MNNCGLWRSGGLATEAQRQQFYADMVEFVGQVDQLVLLLQQRNEHRQTLQQLLQGERIADHTAGDDRRPV